MTAYNILNVLIGSESDVLPPQEGLCLHGVALGVQNPPPLAAQR